MATDSNSLLGLSHFFNPATGQTTVSLCYSENNTDDYFILEYHDGQKFVPYDDINGIVHKDFTPVELVVDMNTPFYDNLVKEIYVGDQVFYPSSGTVYLPGYSASLSELEDVSLSNLQEDDILKYINGTWQNAVNEGGTGGGGVPLGIDGILKSKGDGEAYLALPHIDYQKPIYIQPEEPQGVEEKTLWINTNDHSRYECFELNGSAVLSEEDPEVIFARGAGNIYMHSPLKPGYVKKIFNVGSGSIIVKDTGIGDIFLPTGKSVSLISAIDKWLVECFGQSWPSTN